ncbi:MAG: dTDP-4-dehydrorhamnose 3,5-epimerase family protein [bacterium]
MKILSISPLHLPDVKVVRVERFVDERGYFTEIMRESHLTSRPELSCIRGKHFQQANESVSSAGTIRGLHIQVNPNLDKYLRLISGHIIDLALDIRQNSPTFGQICTYELKSDPDAAYEDMLLIPFGFAHGIAVIEDCRVQYFQTGDWNGDGEASISPHSPEIDWSGVDPVHRSVFESLSKNPKMSEKDKMGISLSQWATHRLAPFVQ